MNLRKLLVQAREELVKEAVAWITGIHFGVSKNDNMAYVKGGFLKSQIVTSFDFPKPPQNHETLDCPPDPLRKVES